MRHRYFVFVLIIALAIGVSLGVLYRRATSPYRGEIIPSVTTPPLMLSYITISNKDPFQTFSFKVAAQGLSVTPVRTFTLAYGWKCDGGYGNGQMTWRGRRIPLGHTETVWVEG
jgi:hypothetical protein